MSLINIPRPPESDSPPVPLRLGKARVSAQSASWEATEREKLAAAASTALAEFVERHPNREFASEGDRFFQLCARCYCYVAQFAVTMVIVRSLLASHAVGGPLTELGYRWLIPGVHAAVAVLASVKMAGCASGMVERLAIKRGRWSYSLSLNDDLSGTTVSLPTSRDLVSARDLLWVTAGLAAVAIPFLYVAMIREQQLSPEWFDAVGPWFFSGIGAVASLVGLLMGLGISVDPASIVHDRLFACTQDLLRSSVRARRRAERADSRLVGVRLRTGRDEPFRSSTSGGE